MFQPERIVFISWSIECTPKAWFEWKVERQKMNVRHFYILYQHLNCKCYLVNMTTTIVPCSTNIGMHGSSFKKQIFIEILKTKKTIVMMICS